MNTKKNCEARFMVYKKGVSFIAVCLDFNIVQEHETIEEAINEITNTALCHYEAVVKNNLPDSHLNKRVNEELIKQWENHSSERSIKTEKGKFLKVKKSTLSPLSYFSLLRFPKNKLARA